jgi:hypothetical protein
MRTIRQVERDLTEAEAIAASGGADQYDNNGRMVMLAAQHAAAYARRAEHLRVELATLRRIFPQSKPECMCHRERGSHELCCGHFEGCDPNCPIHGDGMKG